MFSQTSCPAAAIAQPSSLLIFFPLTVAEQNFNERADLSWIEVLALSFVPVSGLATSLHSNVVVLGNVNYDSRSAV